MSQKSAILAGLYDHFVWLRVSGRGTFQTSAGMKEYSRRMILRGHRSFVIDLTDCELMDSTFMGTMAGMALRLREMGSGTLTVLHANTRNRGLLENLGLDHLFSFRLPEGTRHAPSEVAEKPLPPAAPDVARQQEVIRDAHIALVEADPENEERFKDVLELLEQDTPQD
ncbi:MAG: STAS domain-containing protein, partial [Chthoniobacterales bacterium]